MYYIPYSAIEAIVFIANASKHSIFTIIITSHFQQNVSDFERGEVFPKNYFLLKKCTYFCARRIGLDSVILEQVVIYQVEHFENLKLQFS